MKKFISTLLIITIILSFAPASFASGGIPVYLMGQKIEKEGIIISDRTYLPVRAVCEALGKDVDWVSDTKSVIIGVMPSSTQKRDGINIYLEGTLLENAEAVILDGTTYLPVRALCEALGMAVEWNSELKEVYITENVTYEYPVNIIAESEGFKLLSPYYRQRFLDFTTNNLAIGILMRSKIEKNYIEAYKMLSPEDQKNLLVSMLSETLYFRSQTAGSGTIEPEGEKASYTIRAKTYYRSYEVWKGEYKPIWNHTIDMETADGYEPTHSWSLVSTVENATIVTDIIEAFSRFPYAVRRFVHQIIYDPDSSNTYYGGGNTIWLKISYIPSENTIARDLACVLGYVFDANTTYNAEIWNNAITNDIIPVSSFGNTNRVSDIGEFVSLYHSVKNMENGLSELEKVYPNRFAAHAAMLYVADPINYSHYRAYYEALLKFDDADDNVTYFQILLPGTELVLSAKDSAVGSTATFEKNTKSDNQFWCIRQYKGKKVMLNKETNLCLQIYLGSKSEGWHFVLTNFTNRAWQSVTVTNIAENAHTIMFDHSGLYLSAEEKSAGARAVQTGTKTYVFLEETE